MSKKPARVYEVAFWDQLHNQGGITRTGTWASCPSFIDARYPFTTLLHQGYIEQAFIEDLSKHYVEIQRPWRITGFTSNEVENPDYPVKVNLEHVDGTAREVIHSKYLFGADGSRSFIRKQLKINMKHLDPIQFVWGVIDGVVKTNFPDIKVAPPNLINFDYI
jgi:2-polyprenyl-6-methoxyphenol hydroxylase-like FAD-dependent oxidoreductase